MPVLSLQADFIDANPMRLERVDLHQLRLLFIRHVIAVAIRFFAFVGEFVDFFSP